MANISTKKSEIIRTERGLTISGTRINLYDVIDLLKAEYPPKFIYLRIGNSPTSKIINILRDIFSVISEFGNSKLESILVLVSL